MVTSGDLEQGRGDSDVINRVKMVTCVPDTALRSLSALPEARHNPASERRAQVRVGSGPCGFRAIVQNTTSLST